MQLFPAFRQRRQSANIGCPQSRQSQPRRKGKSVNKNTQVPAAPHAHMPTCPHAPETQDTRETYPLELINLTQAHGCGFFILGANTQDKKQITAEVNQQLTAERDTHFFLTGWNRCVLALNTEERPAVLFLRSGALHPFAGNGPQACVQIQLGPLHHAQVAGTLVQQGNQQQGGAF